jgi:hypothetical protein
MADNRCVLHDHKQHPEDMLLITIVLLCQFEYYVQFCLKVFIFFLQVEWASDCCLTAMSLREQVSVRWDDDIGIVLNRQAWLCFHSATCN